MPSPFPGMNPYLEAVVWHDFHERCIPAIAEALAKVMAPHYIVRIDERVYVRDPLVEPRLVGKPDVSVLRPPQATGSRAGAALLDPPAVVQLPAVDIDRISYAEIRDGNDMKLITVIEILSPSNKYAGSDRDQFLAKRGELLSSPVHYVEIDLLRGGPRLPVKNLPPCDYYVLVSRAETRPDAGIWPIQLRDRLPVIPVPLREEETPAELDLQEILHRVYDAARYDIYVYHTPPKPELNADDAEWAKQFVP